MSTKVSKVTSRERPKFLSNILRRKDRYIGPALYSMLIRKDLGDSPQNEVSFGETKQTNPDPGVRWYNEKNSRLIVESLSTICDIPAPCCT